MNKEERFVISVNQEDVQNIIDCYEKDIKYIKELEQRIDKVDKYIDRLLNTDDPMYLDAVLITIKEILGGKE